MAKSVVIVGTLDTKGEEIEYVKNLLKERGLKTIVIDGGILGKPTFLPDVSREQVAMAAGTSLKEVANLDSEGKAIVVMAEGVAKILQRLFGEGKLDAVLALGGSMGTSLALPAMKTLPLGIPKVMVSTVVLTPFINLEAASKDIILMASPIDLWGLNRITRKTLENASGAVVGMIEREREKESLRKKLVGVTTIGTAACRYVPYVKQLLEKRGYEVAVFPGVGTTFEELIDQGVLDGALDLAVGLQITNQVCGGQNLPGERRLKAGAEKGIPQVFAPAVADVFQFSGAPPPQFAGRKIHWHNPAAVAVRASRDEMAAAGKAMAESLVNMATGPTGVVIPKHGFSEWDKPGGKFYDPEADKAFIEALKRHLSPGIKVVEVDAHVNAPLFAEEAVALFHSLMKGKLPATPAS